MKVLHVISSVSRAAGGTSRSVQGLVAALKELGVDVGLLSLTPAEQPWVPGVDNFLSGVSFPAAIAALSPDLVHVNGIWDPDLHYCIKCCRRRGIPYVITPHGMLEPWSLKQKWLKKRIARFLYQDRDLKKAAALHATAESEAAQFRNLGFRNRCVISANAVNVPACNLVLDRRDGAVGRRVLFVSRMHPGKGVMELVESWARIRPAGWLCELVYTVNGPAERAYEGEIKSRVRRLGLNDQFIFTGPLDDERKWDAFARADLFVLPTYSENFGIVVAEALYAGLPVITTKGAPWHELDLEQCGMWIDIGVEPLAAALREMMSISDAQRTEMGARGRALVNRKYTWRSAAEAMLKGYEEVLRGRS